jgi:4-hydroxy-4-methyl-2-oxoglutarate aldolase
VAILTREEIKELQQFDTPTVSNAIETFEVREPTEGFTKPGLRQIIPYKKPMVGYACTAQVSSLKPPTRAQKKLFMDYFGNILNTPDPTIAVIQDIDPEPVGSLWGEVMSTTHRALGCVGTI